MDTDTQIGLHLYQKSVICDFISLCIKPDSFIQLAIKLTVGFYFARSFIICIMKQRDNTPSCCFIIYGHFQGHEVDI